MLIQEYLDRHTKGRDNLLKFIENPLNEFGLPLHVNEVKRKKLFLMLESYNTLIDLLHEWEKHISYPCEPKAYLTGSEFLNLNIAAA